MIGGLSIREHFALAEGTDDGFLIQWPKVEQMTTARIREYNIVGRPRDTGGRAIGRQPAARASGHAAPQS